MKFVSDILSPWWRIKDFKKQKKNIYIYVYNCNVIVYGDKTEWKRINSIGDDLFVNKKKCLQPPHEIGKQ